MAAALPVLPGEAPGCIRLVSTDIDWERGDGAELRGPVAALLLVSTGRYAALPDVEGPGCDGLAARVA
ncbi:hypothetical protein [Humibacillus xanthopallidus]|uniref:hypothetical protein n=1 Tax=Humibacillus xanthopallidus TaxID=412689 RepID=UPI00115123EC|nr:hypothetical protein [Humibacillus xanthopallidus]